MDEGLEALLLQTSALTAVLKTRVYPQRARQGWGQMGTGEPPRPYLVYSILTAEASIAAQGPVNFHRVRYDLEIAADKYSDARAMMTALVGLNGFKGLAGGFRFLLVKVDDRRGNYAQPVLGDEAGVQDMKTTLYCIANAA
jgi:hypothetical protein